MNKERVYRNAALQHSELYEGRYHWNYPPAISNRCHKAEDYKGKFPELSLFRLPKGKPRGMDELIEMRDIQVLGLLICAEIAKEKDKNLRPRLYCNCCVKPPTKLYYEVMGSMRIVRDGFYNAYCPVTKDKYKFKAPQH